MVGQYPTGPCPYSQVRRRKDCVGGWVSGAPLPIIWHYQSIGVPLFFIEHCREEQFPKGLRQELLPGLNGMILTKFPEYTNPPAVHYELSRTLLSIIPAPLHTTCARFQDTRWAPYLPPEDWVDLLPTTVPLGWFPTIRQTTSQLNGLAEHIQILTSCNDLRGSRLWNNWRYDVNQHRELSIKWKDER